MQPITKLNLSDKNFAANKAPYFEWLLKEAPPVYKGTLLTGMKAYFISRYDDVDFMLKNKSLVRNRASLGKSPFPLPLPKSVELLTESMIGKDGDEHRRLRNLIHMGFSKGAIDKLSARISEITDELIETLKDKSKHNGVIELRDDFAHPIPIAVIAEMVGIDKDEIPELAKSVNALTDGFSGLRILKTIAFDMPKAVKYTRGIVQRKKKNPGDDILSRLIDAEEEGERLSEDELVATVFLLIMAGHETTYNLITNAMHILLKHKKQLNEIRENNELIAPAIEETLRHSAPIYATKPEYPIEDFELHGVVIPKHKMVMNLIGAANRDPAVFENPNDFNIHRENTRHFGFGVGPHFCLGASLARLETRIALEKFLEAFQSIEFEDESKIQFGTRPGWHELKELRLRVA